MESQYQVRHSSFKSSKFEYKFISSKSIIHVLGKSYKLSSETISVYNSLIQDVLTFIFSDANNQIIAIEDINASWSKAILEPYSSEIIQFSYMEMHLETSDDSYKEKYDSNTLDRSSANPFLFSKQGKVVELDAIKSECSKLSSALSKHLKDEATLSYLRCLVQVFASFIMMLICKKCLETDAAVIKTEDFFKLLSECDCFKDFVDKSDSKRNNDKRESIVASKRNTIQLSELIQKSEPQEQEEPAISESEKRMAQVDLEHKKTIVKPKKISEEHPDELLQNTAIVSPTEDAKFNNRVVPEKRKVKYEARVEVPKREAADFTENERKNLQSLLDFLDTDPDTIIGNKKPGPPEVNKIKDKENLVRKSFKVFANIKSSGNKKSDKSKILEEMKKEELFTSEDSFEDKFIKKDKVIEKPKEYLLFM